MEFRLLGPLEVEDDAKPIHLGGAKQRALFALLLLDRGHAVSTDRLIDEIWTGDPPQTAAKSIQVYVSSLRKALGEGRIVTRERGYELRVEPGETDVDRFDQLVRAAPGAPPAEAAVRLHEALELVRGRPLEDVSLEPWAAAEVARLDERILAAREARIDADLALGRDRELVPELEELVVEFPFRERLLEQLMLTLYRSGRQADALDAYRRGAARLREDLGLEPGRPLRELEAAMLRHDPELDVESPPQPVVVERLRRRRRAWKFLVAGSVAAIVAATAATVVAATHGDASLESLPPGVALIDADTGHLRAHISEAEIPQPVEVVAGAGSFWVWNLQPYSLIRIEPRTGEILKRIGSPFSGDAGWYLPDGRDVWFTGTRDVVRVDVDQNQEVDRFPLLHTADRFGLAWIARCAGSLWITNNEGHQVLRVNPATGRIQARIHVLWPWPIACGDGGVWVGSNLRGLRRIDPTTNTVVATAPIPQRSFYSAAVGGGYAWTSDETKGVVYKIDRNGRIVATYETGDGARQVSFGNGRLWVANSDAGTVTGIDASSGDMTTYRFGHPVLSVAALGDSILVELDEGLTYEERIDGLGGDVAKLIVPIYNFDPPDPALGWNWSMFMVERATCSMLLRRPASPSSALEPDLAVAPPRVSHDGRTYTFTVRSGVRFAPPSNAEVTAATVRSSIERALSPRLGDGSPGIGELSDVVGAIAFNEGKAARVRGIRVRGDTISFTLTRAAPDFPERVSLPYFCTVPAETPLVHGGVQPIAPPSAGPFYMAERENGEYMILRRNPNYDGPAPSLDAIGFREGIAPEQAVARVDDRRADGLLLVAEPLLASNGPVARRSKGASTSRYEPLHLLEDGGFLALNAQRPLFADARVRRVASRALDRTALASIWGQTPTASLLRPGIRGYESVPGLSLTGVATSRLAPTRQARMGVPKDCDPCRQTFETVRTALAPVGIRVTAVEIDDSTVIAPGDGLDIVDWGFGIAYADGASLLRRLLDTGIPRSWFPRGVESSIESVDRLPGRARDDAAARLAVRLAVRDVPVVAYGYYRLDALLSRRLGCDDVEGELDLTKLCVSSD